VSNLYRAKAGLVFGLGLLAVVLVGAQDPEFVSQTPPPGWYVYPMDRLDSPTIRCLIYSNRGRTVSIDGGQLKIADYKPQKTEQPELPEHFTFKPEWRRGAGRHVIKFDGGWLVGIDAGEWGGGLWITNQDGTISKQIVMDNIKGIIPASGGIFVFSGLAHLHSDFGNVLMLSDPRYMHVTFEWSAHLMSAPQASAVQYDNSVLTATKFDVTQFTSSGEMKCLFWIKQFRGYPWYINSIAETADGTIYLGSQVFVLRFRPTGVRHVETLSDYSEDLLLPNQCRQFVISSNQCVCSQ
jgi:hypothetical protein